MRQVVEGRAGEKTALGSEPQIRFSGESQVAAEEWTHRTGAKEATEMLLLWREGSTRGSHCSIREQAPGENTAGDLCVHQPGKRTTVHRMGTFQPNDH